MARQRTLAVQVAQALATAGIEAHRVPGHPMLLRVPAAGLQVRITHDPLRESLAISGGPDRTVVIHRPATSRVTWASMRVNDWIALLGAALDKEGT